MDDIIDVPTEWFNWADKSSPVHFLGTHCYDQVRWYMGCEVEEVYAVGTKKVLKARGVDTYDSIQATLKMENGCYWTVENSWILPKGFAKIMMEEHRSCAKMQCLGSTLRIVE